MTGAEMLILVGGTVVLILGLIMLVGSRPPRRYAEPPALPLAPASPPALTFEEATAVEQARAIGQAVEFLQLHPQTAQPAMFRATPMSDGRTLISVAQPGSQIPTVPTVTPSMTKWVP